MANDTPLWLAVAGAVAIPLAIAALPFIAEWRRRRGFLRLLDRELAEITPESEPISRAAHPGDAWKLVLPKRFVHEAFVSDPAANRAFLLDLPPGLVYELTQMWNHFQKAEGAIDWEELAQHGERFCDYLGAVLTARRADLTAVNRWRDVLGQIQRLARESQPVTGSEGPRSEGATEGQRPAGSPRAS